MPPMLRSIWEWLLHLDPRLSAAIIAGVVSIAVTTISILFTPIGNYLLAKRQLRDKLRTEYQYEQRKKLKELIGRYHGRVLQAAEEFHYRMLALYVNEDQRWLKVDENYRKVGADSHFYFFQTSVHRFLTLFTLVRQLEAEALYADSRIADEQDFEFIKYTRVMLWVITSPSLFSGLNYDEARSTDHFFKDDLRRTCNYCWVKDNEGTHLISLDELREDMGKAEWLHPTLDFFRNLRASEDRYRWDRLVALHIILIAFVADFGYEFQDPTGYTKRAIEQFRTREVPWNLLKWLPALGLEARRGSRRGIRAVTEPLKTNVADGSDKPT